MTFHIVVNAIAVGINSPAATNSRASQMLAFGRDGILDNDAVIAVTDYVRSLTDPGVTRGAGAKSVAAGRAVFAANCVACHGPDARGNQSLGAPDLADRTFGTLIPQIPHSRAVCARTAVGAVPFRYGLRMPPTADESDTPSAW